MIISKYFKLNDKRCHKLISIYWKCRMLRCDPWFTPGSLVHLFFFRTSVCFIVMFYGLSFDVIYHIFADVGRVVSNPLRMVATTINSWPAISFISVRLLFVLVV